MTFKSVNHVDNYIDKLAIITKALERMRESGIEDIIGVSVSVGRPEISIHYDDIYLILSKQSADVKKNPDGSYEATIFFDGVRVRAILPVSDKRN